MQADCTYVQDCAGMPDESEPQHGAARPGVPPHLYYVQELHDGGDRAPSSSTSRSTGVAPAGVRAGQRHRRHPHHVAARPAPQLLSRARRASASACEAHVVPGAGRRTRARRPARSGRAGGRARCCTQHVESNLTIGVAWGSTMAAVSRHLVAKPVHDATIVQVNGVGQHAHHRASLYASEILSRFGDGIRRRRRAVPRAGLLRRPRYEGAPCGASGARGGSSTCSRRWDSSSSASGRRTRGSRAASYAGGYLEPADRADLASDGVVGDVATVFYRQDGSSEGIRLNTRATGPDFDALRRVVRRCCVVSGVSKVDEPARRAGGGARDRPGDRRGDGASADG